MSLPEVRAQKVEQREEENPDDVHEMPIEPGHLHRARVFGRKVPARRQNDQHRQHAGAHHHVQRVDARHHEIEEHEELDMGGLGAGNGPIQSRRPAFPVVGRPFEEPLDAEEGESQDECGEQEKQQRLAFTSLGGVHGQGHGQAAQNENAGVGGAKDDFQVMATEGEGRIVKVTEDRITREQAAKEHHLRGEEDPHAEACRLVLLLAVVELLRHRRGMGLGQVAASSVKAAAAPSAGPP